MTGITVRPLETLHEFKDMERLYAEIFGLMPVDAMPAWALDYATKVGGISLGAYRGDEMVGFSFGLIGVREGKPYIASVASGVLEAYRSQGIERQLKMEQRRVALERGYDFINWSFSALRAPNAHVFLSRLGGVARVYEIDTFGGLGFGAREANVIIDEWVVEWYIRSQRVADRLAGQPPPPLRLDNTPVVTRTYYRDDDLIVLDGFDNEFDVPCVLAEVPEEVQDIIDRDHDLAMDWRLKTRGLFMLLMERGYTLTECLSDVSGVKRRNFYLFEKDYEVV